MRHLRVLIEHLPPSSAFHRAVNGHSWQDTEYLLAIVADRLAENTYVAAKAAGSKPRKPKPIPRPGDSDKGRLGDRGGRSSEEVMTYLDQFKPGSNISVPAQPGMGG